MTKPASVTQGNEKLGNKIHSWSIPADKTCPGKSRLCASTCYAKKGFFCMPAVANVHQANYLFSKTDEFVPWMLAELRSQWVKVLRCHAAGDLYDNEYIRKWIDIARRSQRVTTYLYTRSWRCDELFHDILRLSRQPNVVLWFSEDLETGPAPLIPGIRRAYMAIDDVDAQNAPDDVDLVFRDKDATPMKRANGVLVCPVENGVQHKSGFKHTCTNCGICWSRQATAAWEEELLPLLQADTQELLAPTRR